MNKNNLLTIGELSKLAKVSVQAIRHYEKIELLKPTYVDPETNYRYYSLHHPELLDYIILALEFDIPLKTLRDYFKNEDMIEISSLVTYAKEQANEKISRLQRSLVALCKIETVIEKHDKFPINEIYKRTFTTGKFISNTIDDVSEGKLKCLQLYQTIPYDIEETPGFGVMIKKAKGRTSTFAVVEASIHSKNANLIIPAGIWTCYKSYDTSTKHIHKIFTNYLSLDDDFVAIESEVISSKIHIEKPLFELRVLKIP